MEEAEQPHSAHLTLPPTTTEQQNMVTAGQRRINVMWERTQSAIALFVVLISLSVGGWLAITSGKEVPTLFSLTLGTVIGFYFSRTNHQNVGGVGPKASEGPDSRR